MSMILTRLEPHVRVRATILSPLNYPCREQRRFNASRTAPMCRSPSNGVVMHGEAMLDGRARLSRLWAPSGGITAVTDEDAHGKLLRAGFLRQAYSGIFHLLPLGRRVQDKVEGLIDKYMYGLGASKVSLSSVSSEDMWSRSGRLESAGSELFRFKDRKEFPYLLSPTHEEEITSLVSGSVKSYKDLPVRLYQISRKYRDELRPRHGLLRGREFVMKDLYTFDYSPSLALATYHQVRGAYAQLFDELKLPYLVAEADSGDIGGDLSHEFHFPTSKGEDHIISCNKCDYVANEELAESRPITHELERDARSVKLHLWRGVSKDRLTLFNVWCLPSSRHLGVSPDFDPLDINSHAIKAVLPDFDPSITDPMSLWRATNTEEQQLPRPKKLVTLIDGSVPAALRRDLQSSRFDFQPPVDNSQPFGDMEVIIMGENPATGRPLNLLRIKSGDSCPRCPDGLLGVQKAIELGHTFHLGTRYSGPMMANVTVPADVLTECSVVGESNECRPGNNQQVPMQMGCYGIGVSRIIGAVADTLADDKGLNWPRVMAPYEVVVVSPRPVDGGALEVYDNISFGDLSSDRLPLDVVLDDREESFAWKMKDADLVGYPVIVVVGRGWESDRICEVQCRRLKINEKVAIDKLRAFIGSILEEL